MNIFHSNIKCTLSEWSRKGLLKTGICFPAAIFLLLFLCPAVAFAAGPLEIFVSIPPQAYIAEQIGGDHITTVHVLVPDGREPHTFEPAPKQILALGRAKLYFTLGVPFEKQFLKKIRSSNTLRVVDSAEGIKKRPITEYDTGKGLHHGKRHESGHDHLADDLDPHIWLAPPLTKIMAKNMADALIAADPANAMDYRNNLNLFHRRIDAVHARIKKLLKPFAGRSFYAFHPAFGYFGDTYNLRQQALELEGKTPTPKQLSELIEAAKADKVKVIFVQPQFDSKSAAAIAGSIDGAVVEMDSMARDLLKNFENMAQLIKKAFTR